MDITIYNIKKWYRMLTGKSILHVKQNMGSVFVPGELNGYYNNLTEKVTKEPKLLESEELPTLKTEKGKIIYFPVSIFQYGLGAYDLYLMTNEKKYLDKFEQCANWAIKNQQSNGAWSNFFYIYPEHPYGAMCQGEGASLLSRAYKHYANSVFSVGATKAIDFMLRSTEDGGTAQYKNDELILLEYTHLSAVMNGWIFALFGLYDLTLVNDDEKYKKALSKTLSTLQKYLPKFDNGYWSLYDLDIKIASPFYHNLHIAQLEALYVATGHEIFYYYQQRFNMYASNRWNRNRAFFLKALQKVVE